MSIQKRKLLFLGLALLAVGCGQQESKTEGADKGARPDRVPLQAVAQRLPQESLPVSDVVLIDVNSADKQPLALGSQNEFKGVVQAPRDGAILGVDFRVGTYLDTSNGTFKLEICDGGVCRKGEADIRSSMDNAMFPILLDGSLDVKTSDELTFKLVKDGGEVPLAIWAYAPAPGSTLKFYRKDGSDFGRVPMIALRYATN